MKRSWNDARDEWLRKTSLPDELSLWALESLTKNEKEIYAVEGSTKGPAKDSDLEIFERLKSLKKSIKGEILNKENSLDELSLNAPNSYKLQVSVPSSLNYLMKAWAAAEGRDLSSIALQCLEIGLRAMKSKGSIPSSALQRYDIACERRIALAEINSAWEKYESSAFKAKVTQ